MTAEEVETQFRELASPVVGDKTCREIYAKVMGPDKLEGLRELTRLLRTNSG